MYGTNNLIKLNKLVDFLGWPFINKIILQICFNANVNKITGTKPLLILYGSHIKILHSWFFYTLIIMFGFKSISRSQYETGNYISQWILEVLNHIFASECTNIQIYVHIVLLLYIAIFKMHCLYQLGID